MKNWRKWCKGSLTILWARLQTLLGVVLTVAATVDFSPIISAKWLPVWLVISGTITELTRRRTLDDA